MVDSEVQVNNQFDKKFDPIENFKNVLRQVTGGVKLTKIEFEFALKNNTRLQDAYSAYQDRLEHQQMLKEHERKRKLKKKRKKRK